MWDFPDDPDVKRLARYSESESETRAENSLSDTYILTLLVLIHDGDVCALSHREIYEKGGVTSAVCHGPIALINVRLTNGEYLVSGKEVAAFTDDEEDAVKRRDVVPFTCHEKLAERGAKIRQALSSHTHSPTTSLTPPHLTPHPHHQYTLSGKAACLNRLLPCQAALSQVKTRRARSLRRWRWFGRWAADNVMCTHRQNSLRYMLVAGDIRRRDRKSQQPCVILQ
jgi:hypothetical protein